LSQEAKDHWLFWRIVLLGNESYAVVDNFTLTEMIQYNQMLDLKDKLELIMSEPEAGNK
jgi:hypothetical protein